MIKTEEQKIKELIFGKDDTQRIVSVENDEKGNFYVYRQELDGKISLDVSPSNFWFLTTERISSKQKELEGDQPYKFLAEFKTQKERDNVIRMVKKEGLDVYRIYDQKEQSLIFRGMTYYKGLQPHEISTLSFDLETSTLQHQEDSRILIITNTYRAHDGTITRKNFSLDDYNDDEREMIGAWIKWVRLMDPSIVVAHNGFCFDMDYLRFRTQELKLRFALGRNGSSVKYDNWSSSKRKDGSQEIEYVNCHIFGREIVDSMFLAITYDVARNFPSYGLKPIIKYLGLEKEGRTFVDATKIGRYYKDHLLGNSENWLLAKKYAEEDSDDALKLFDLMIPSFVYVANSVSKSFQGIINSATGSQLNNIMVRGYLQDGHSVAKADQIGHIKGGISFAVPGIYRNLFKIDIKSAYPSQILRLKLFDKNKDPRGYYYEIAKYFTYQRFEYKKMFRETENIIWKNLDAAAKVFINSLYGLTATNGLNYNAEWIGAKITEETRNIIDMALHWASGKKSDYWFKIFREKMGIDCESEGELSEAL